MTMDEAIKILHLYSKDNPRFIDPDFIPAIKLGIEALKAWREHRRIMGHPKLWILPGETKPVYRGMTETMFINPERD